MQVEWGSVADWVSGLGSLAAAVVALYVAVYSQKVKLRCWAGERVVIGGGDPKFDVMTISATNLSQRPTVITSVTFTLGKGKEKRHGIINLRPDDLGPGVPKALQDGETATWSVRLGANDEWALDFVKKFSLTVGVAKTWKIYVHTSNGGAVKVSPESSIVDRIVKNCPK